MYLQGEYVIELVMALQVDRFSFNLQLALFGRAFIVCGVSGGVCG